jgi:Uma2 family endonuclease
MAGVNEKRMSAEEFAALKGPPGFRLELVRGEVVKVCRPGFSYGLHQLRIGAILDQFGRSTKQGRATVETGVTTEEDPDTVRGPDISYWSAQRLPLDQEPEGYPEAPPDLCVEVLSRSNRAGKIRKKLREYFARDVRMVWVVNLKRRTVTIYRSLDEGHIFHDSATVSGEDVLPGFSYRVADLLA